MHCYWPSEWIFKILTFSLTSLLISLEGTRWKQLNPLVVAIEFQKLRIPHASAIWRFGKIAEEWKIQFRMLTKFARNLNLIGLFDEWVRSQNLDEINLPHFEVGIFARFQQFSCSCYLLLAMSVHYIAEKNSAIHYKLGEDED